MNELIPYHKIKAIFFNNERYQRLLLILVLILCLVPFVDKAFHIDDPLFIWAAEQILKNPGDYYGFFVNWFSFYTPMYHCMMNPPFTSYFMAGVIGLFGLNEVTLHLAFLFISIICALGIFEVAKEMGTDPLSSSLIAVLSPFFLVSASNVMSDVLMLTFWIWSVVLWMKGLRGKKGHLFFLSAILIAFCILTKYLGVIVIGLILIYHLTYQRRFELRLLYLAIPITAVIFYELYNIYLYGNSHLNLAATFSLNIQSFFSNKFLSFLLSLVFLGGGAIVFIFLPFVTRTKKLIYGFIIIAAISLIIFVVLKMSQSRFPSDILRQVQIYLMIMAGLNILFIGIMKLLEDQDAKSLLILAWIAGPFLFAGLVNWTVNGRTLLPAVPAISILLICFLNSPKNKIKYPPIVIGAALLVSAVISIALLNADYRSANAARYSANYILKHYGKYSGEITFQGHWGFQYYMQDIGFMAVNVNSFKFRKDDIMIVPSTQILFPITLSLPEHFGTLEKIETDTFRCVGVHNTPAAFYSSTYGPAPYFFGPDFSENYVLHKTNISFYITKKDLLAWKAEIMKLYGLN